MFLRSYHFLVKTVVIPKGRRDHKDEGQETEGCMVTKVMTIKTKISSPGSYKERLIVNSKNER